MRRVEYSSVYVFDYHAARPYYCYLGHTNAVMSGTVGMNRFGKIGDRRTLEHEILRLIIFVVYLQSVWDVSGPQPQPDIVYSNP
jgi:hypothetical protein